MKRTYRILPLLLLVLLFGCSKDDEPTEEETFYSNALVSAKEESLSGAWAIYSISFEGQNAEVPENYPECGRDFFQFLGNGDYLEHITVDGYECAKQTLELRWELANGVIRLSNGWQTEEMVILELTSDKLVFRTRMDIDEDGVKDVLIFTALQYAPPNDYDIFTRSFHQAESRDQIRLQWEAYHGFYPFDRYEIYRSTEGCSISKAELVASIEDPQVTFFVEENPPSADMCYFFRLYTEKGLVGENSAGIITDWLEPASVELSEIKVVNGAIELNWLPYEGAYFSHYEITVRNYESGYGSGYQEIPLAKIENREVTQFTDPEPPYVINPVYAIYVYDIFGNVNESSGSAINAYPVTFQRPELLPYESIREVIADPDRPQVYLYGSSLDGSFELIKYDYSIHQVTATGSHPRSSTQIPLQLYRSANGRELFFAQSRSLEVYDAADLSHKYALEVNEVAQIQDFARLNDDLWVFTDSDFVYTYRRDNANMSLLDKKPHFSAHQGSYNYKLVAIEDGKVLVGHINEPKSYVFSVDGEGKLSHGELVDIPLKSGFYKDEESIYSPEQDYLLNLSENRIYSTETFSYQSSFEQPYHPRGISRNGSTIFGTDNDPESGTSGEADQEKLVKSYNLLSGELQANETKGYPLLLFENHLGQLLSISSGFKKGRMERTGARPDLFIEVVE